MSEPTPRGPGSGRLDTSSADVSPLDPWGETVAHPAPGAIAKAADASAANGSASEAEDPASGEEAPLAATRGPVVDPKSATVSLSGAEGDEHDDAGGTSSPPDTNAVDPKSETVSLPDPRVETATLAPGAPGSERAPRAETATLAPGSPGSERTARAETATLAPGTPGARSPEQTPRAKPAHWKARLRQGLAEHEVEREPNPGGDLTSPIRGSRFAVVRELGRGGMGVVFECQDTLLGRRVALKVLLAGEFASGETLERFQIEARAAARLRHPNIVGVHEVGEEGGRSFMVMDLIEGEGLEKVLRNEGYLVPSVAATITLKLAHALDYAHERSILHRDIKPANVLITPEGEPLLTDFGLAKEIERTSGGPTTSGHVMGTPAYMSPEQASGLPVDARSDVYSLGATLYELLTGQPPFTGLNVASVLNNVLRNDPSAPSLLRPGLDRDLETICLKCLEKEPKLRYQSAADLAEDLERFVSHQTIRARRPTVRERASKWLRRNRALARALSITVGLALGVLLISGGVFLNRVSHERNRYQQAAKEANEALNMLVYEVRDELGDISNPEVRRVRSRLLTKAAERLEALQELQPEVDRPSARQACEAYRQIGDLKRSAGDIAGAAKLYDKALAIARRLAADAPPEERAGWEVGVSLLRVVDIRIHQGDWEGALAPAEEAVAALGKSGGVEIAFALARLGAVYQALGDPLRAKDVFETELRIAIAAAKRFPDDPATTQAVAAALLHVGEAREALGDLDGALAQYVAATQATRRLFELKPGRTSTLRDLRGSLLRAGEIHFTQGDLTKARAAFEEGSRLDREWLKRDPSDFGAAEQILSSLGRVGDAAYRQGDLVGAQAAFQEMLERARELHEQGSGSEEVAHNLQAALGRIASLRKLAGDLPAARAGFEEVYALALEESTLHPDRVAAQFSMGSVLMQLGDVGIAQGDLPAALDALERCLTLRRGLARDRPKEARMRTDLVDTLTEMIEIYELLGRAEDSLAAGEEAIALARAILEDEPSNQGARRALAIGLDRVGRVRLFQNRLPEALVIFHECVALAKQLRERDPSGVDAQRLHATSLVNVATVLRRQDQTEQALATYQEALALRRELCASASAGPGDQRKLAICLSGLADLRRAGGDLQAAEQTYREVLATNRALLADDPTNAETKRDVFVALMRVGEVRQDQQDYPSAVEFYAEASAARRRDWEAQPSDAVARRDLFEGTLRLARLQHGRQRFPEAKAAYLELLPLQRALVAEEPDNPRQQRTLVTLVLKLAEVYQGLEEWDLMLEALKSGAREGEVLARLDPSFAGSLKQIQGFVRGAEAQQALRRGTRAAQDPEERLVVARAHLAAKRYPEALKGYEELLVEDSLREDLNRSCLYEGVLAAVGAGNTERALEWLAEDVGRRRAAIRALGEQEGAAEDPRKRGAIAAAREGLVAALERAKSAEPAFAALRELPRFAEIFAEPEGD